MGVKVNGTDLPTSGEPIKIGGQVCEEIKVNGVSAWKKNNGSDSPVIIDTSGTYTAGTDFPQDTELTIIACGGGGSGAFVPEYQGHAGGGHSGAIESTTSSLADGDTLEITIGDGGAGQTGFTNGIAGGVTEVTHNTSPMSSANGGAGGVYASADYAGNGAERTTELGTANDGGAVPVSGYYRYGGQSSGYVNGGGSAGNGTFGSGGGGHIRQNQSQTISGRGGNGMVMIKW